MGADEARRVARAARHLLLVALSWLLPAGPAVADPAIVDSAADPAKGAAAPAGPRYRHRTHEQLGVPLTCTVCHDTTARGQPTFPGASEHTPCANAGCHGETFAEREPKLCLACHTRQVPWGRNPVRRHLDGDEFSVRFSHASHLGRADGGALLGKGCAACHPTQAGKTRISPTAAQPAPGHTRCASCHLQLARPRMSECDACHVADRVGAVTRAGTASGDDTWRVAARFSHAGHTHDPRGAMLRASPGDSGWRRFDKMTAKPLACAECHSSMVRVDTGERATRPAKADCAPCHSGTYAFKVTGFGCHRCHGSPASDATGSSGSEGGP